MSIRAEDHFDEIRLGGSDNGVVIYDRTNERAWIEYHGDLAEVTK